MPHLDVHASLVACKTSTAARWEFLREFAEHRALSIPIADLSPPSTMLHQDRIVVAEQRLGVTLPASLKAAYELLGHRPDLTSNQDTFLPPEKLYIDKQENPHKTNKYLVFRTENQGAAVWGIQVPVLCADPPVFMCLTMSDEQADQWHQWASSFSEALVELVLSEAMHDPTSLTYTSFEECDRLELERRFKRLPFPQYHTESQCTFSWYTHGPDLLLRYDGSEVMIRARTENSVHQLEKEHSDIFTGLVPNGYL
ncbi:hypothetical protein LOZ53_002044 [Ophidiomyces ophidiicola]|uniref:uncharacterized protein n=1 Tax=Ophidiomyces ophidiicola TaxID=1387563 RepID=UPI0020C45FE0|nr:uncharacterized protein LOZ57_006354 [Ophidiomyces ophidiicola]KAI1931911.1 hypothetical protein LOZ62_006741 [Ophidiomyces ophidiicola]KAI1938391.1 hypothetical protein LOZ57_006354 [Ophidiomyces ophidiicola]KAI1949449.1 hypothetical protein LOZ59_006093 [Ophidiomyces ophidiicola]KAI1961737.1 hypothetical protein LOZ56_006697 [Ophidiomyces ophidiicola]KAI1976972.1 hypothetical protein LOZ55_003884 [Ophidiomyces ophidiicola]